MKEKEEDYDDYEIEDEFYKKVKFNFDLTVCFLTALSLVLFFLDYFNYMVIPIWIILLPVAPVILFYSLPMLALIFAYLILLVCSLMVIIAAAFYMVYRTFKFTKDWIKRKLNKWNILN